MDVFNVSGDAKWDKSCSIASLCSQIASRATTRKVSYRNFVLRHRLPGTIVIVNVPREITLFRYGHVFHITIYKYGGSHWKNKI